MSNLAKRVLTAVFGVPLLFYLFYVGGIPFLLLVLIIIFLGLREFYNIMEAKGFRANWKTGVLGGVALGVAAYFGGSYLLYLALTLSILAVFFVQLSRGDFFEAISGISTTILGVVYVGWLLGHAILMRNIACDSGIKEYAEGVQRLRDAGFFYLFFVVSCTFLNDTGAYFIGRWFGRRSLSSKISPGKTVEGTIGGIASSMLTAAIANLIFGSPLEYTWALLIGAVIGVSGVAGDLTESLIKREANVKDSGGILPGHGGILDRFDSLLFTIPVSYYLLILYYYVKGTLH